MTYLLGSMVQLATLKNSRKLLIVHPILLNLNRGVIQPTLVAGLLAPAILREWQIMLITYCFRPMFP